jgi:predicted Zn-dependent peptidase
VAGNFDWEQVISQCEGYSSSWGRARAGREASERYSRQQSEFKLLERPELRQGHILLMTEGPTAQDELRYEFSVLSCILGDGEGSKLYWELVDSGLAEVAQTESEQRDRVGVFSAYAATRPDQVEEVTAKIRSILNRPLDWSEAELEKAKNKIVSRLALQGDSAMGRFLSLGNYWQNHHQLQKLADTIQRVKAVSRSSIANALERFPLNELSEYRLLASGLDAA